MNRLSHVILVIRIIWRDRVRDKLRQYQPIRVVDTTGSKYQPTTTNLLRLNVRINNKGQKGISLECTLQAYTEIREAIETPSTNR